MVLALIEIKRVLKKGGILTAVEPLEHQYHHGPHLSQIEWKNFLKKQAFMWRLKAMKEQ